MNNEPNGKLDICLNTISTINFVYLTLICIVYMKKS